MKHHGTNNRDYISKLPDDIMSNILSRLETKDAVRTCVLSKDWDRKWTSVDVININETSIKKGSWLRFVEFVDRVIFIAQNVRRFYFRLNIVSLPDYYETKRMDTWLDLILSTRKVEKVKFGSFFSISLPKSFSTCTSLIELDMDISFDWKSPVCSDFPNLTRLHLSHVTIWNVNSESDTLKFHFPVLKTFEIGAHLWFNVKNVELHAPVLISFLSGNCISKEPYTIKIIGPSLQNFETYDYYLDNFLLIGPTVSSAALKNCYNDINGDVDADIVLSGVRIRNLMKQFSSLSSLELTWFLSQALAGTKSGNPLSSFPKLETLAVSSRDEYCSGGRIEGIFEGLFELLRSAPVLKSLNIEGFSMLGLDSQENYDSDMMELVPSCVVSHLEEFKMKRCSGLKQELHLIKYFLEKGTQLKKLSINCIGGKKDEVKEQVSEYLQASACLTIVIEEKINSL